MGSKVTRKKTFIFQIKKRFRFIPQLELALLIGSRAQGTYTPDSDWDIAIQWQKNLSFMRQLELTEILRHQCANILNTKDNNIDLIDLTTANLTLRAEIAEHGILLKGENTLAWSHFLLKTWREMEEVYWDKCYAT